MSSCGLLPCDWLVQVDELKHGGRDIQVNNSNRIEYIHLMADYRLNKQVCILEYIHLMADYRLNKQVCIIEYIHLMADYQLNKELMAVWRNNSAVGRINIVTLHQAWLVLGWVTVLASIPPRSVAKPCRPPQSSILIGVVNDYRSDWWSSAARKKAGVAHSTCIGGR